MRLTPIRSAAVRRSSFVYFVAAPSAALIKIGLAEDITRRIEVLRAFSPVPLLLLGSLPGDRTTERALHVRFASERSHSEWFRASDELRAYIAQHATIPDAGEAMSSRRRVRPYRTRMGASFSEGARLAWLALDRRFEGSQVRLREELGCGDGVIVRWLYGDRVPSTKWAMRIEEVLGVPASAWLEPPTRRFTLPGVRAAA